MMKFRQNEFYSTYFVEHILSYELYLVISIKNEYTGPRDLFLEIIDDKGYEKNFVRNRELETKVESSFKESAEAMMVQEDVLVGVINDLRIIVDEIGKDNAFELKGSCCQLRFHELNQFMFKYKSKLMIKKDGQIVESKFSVDEFEGLRKRLGTVFSKVDDGSRFPEFFEAVSCNTKPDLSLVKINNIDSIMVWIKSKDFDIEASYGKGLLIEYNNGNNEDKRIIISKDNYDRMFVVDDYNLQKSKYVKSRKIHHIKTDGMVVIYESCLGYSAEQVARLLELDKETLPGFLKDLTFSNWNNFIIRHNTISRRPQFSQKVYVLDNSYVFYEPNSMLKFHICEDCVKELDEASERMNKFFGNNEIALSKRYRF